MKRRARSRLIDAGWVEKLRKDFLTLMKNLPRVKDYAEADKLRDAFKTYRANFELWVFDEFLNALKDRSDTSFEGLRKSAWDFLLELSFPLGYPDSHYDDNYNKPEVLFMQFARKRDAWAARLKRKAQECWKTFKYYLDWKSEQKVEMDLPDEDQLVLEGFQVRVVGWDPKEGWQVDAFERFKESMRLYRRRAKSVMPWLLKRQLPLTLTFNGKLDEGGLYMGAFISISMSAMINQPPEWGAHMMAHEMAHHLFKHLSTAASTYWHAAIRQDYGPIDLRNLMEQWPPSVMWTDDFAKLFVEKDPILSLQLDVLGRERGGNMAWEKRERFQRALDEGETTVAVPMHPITGYAGKNPEESFCEAIGRLVGYGRQTVHPQVLEWLETVIAGMIKTSHRVAERYLMPARVAARYLEAKGKAKGLSLLPDFDKAVEKLEGGDNGPILAFAEHVVSVLYESSGKEWMAGLSVQKINALNKLGRAAQFLSRVHWDSVNAHPGLLASTIREVKEWRKGIRTLEIASTLGDEVLELKRGPFAVVPIPGLTKAEMEGALEALDAATAKLQAKCPKVLYGKVFFSKHIQKGTSARYSPDQDALALNVLAKRRFDDVFTIIHELGHRHEYKFLSKEGKTKYWDLSTRKVYERIHFDAKLREQMADEAVQLAKFKAMGKPLPAPSENLVWWLKSPHPHQEGDVRKLTSRYLEGDLDEKELHAAVKGSRDESVMTDKILHGPLHVTPYGATKPGENYADGFAHFVLGMDMPAQLAAILADELK